jgi:hypothetical protein
VDASVLDGWNELDGEERKCHRQHQKDTPLPEFTDEDSIRSAKSLLHDHISVSNVHSSNGTSTALFFVELAPPTRGAACQHPTCNESIKEDNYRNAVHLRANNYRNAGETGRRLLLRLNMVN